jgi:hypothetical protein
LQLQINVISLLIEFIQITDYDNKLIIIMRYHRYLEMGLFTRPAKKKSGQNDKTVSYDDALRTGSSIGKLITNIWNSQKNPGKAYILNRRVHHGEVGILLGLSNLIKKSRPATAGVFSGLGDALAQNDIADKEEWFSFKEKEDKTKLKKSATEPERKDNEKENNAAD